MSNYCKNCGKEIPENSKTDSCEYCQNKKNGKIRRIFEGVIAIGVFVVSVGLVEIVKEKLGDSEAHN